MFAKIRFDFTTKNWIILTNVFVFTDFNQCLSPLKLTALLWIQFWNSFDIYGFSLQRKKTNLIKLIHSQYSILCFGFMHVHKYDYNRDSLAWGLALLWIVLSCKWGLAKPIDRLLSLRAMLPLSRLTYCAYLVHPVTQIAMSLDLKGTVHIQHGFIFTIFLGNVVTSYSIALILSLLFEAPVVRLLKILFSK